ncbi:MAG: pyridoxal-phosphate dependent enzyme [Thermoplasmatales archaeon]|nr:pyridoxal-phosphate dependent enzyme [Thermoplasmatales archaeon]
MPEIYTVIVPVGGGGIVSGISVVRKSLSRMARVIGVQSEDNPALVEVYHGRDTVISVKESIADGMITKEASDLTLSIIKKNVDDMVPVTEEEIEKSLLAFTG